MRRASCRRVPCASAPRPNAHDAAAATASVKQIAPDDSSDHGDLGAHWQPGRAAAEREGPVPHTPLHITEPLSARPISHNLAASAVQLVPFPSPSAGWRRPWTGHQSDGQKENNRWDEQHKQDGEKGASQRFGVSLGRTLTGGTDGGVRPELPRTSSASAPSPEAVRPQVGPAVSSDGVSTVVADTFAAATESSVGTRRSSASAPPSPLAGAVAVPLISSRCAAAIAR